MTEQGAGANGDPSGFLMESVMRRLEKLERLAKLESRVASLEWAVAAALALRRESDADG